MDKDDGRVVSNFIVQALRGEDITLYGDGEQTRSFCFVSDLTEDYLTRYYSDSFQSKLEVIRSLYVPTSKNYLKEWIHFFGEMNA